MDPRELRRLTELFTRVADLIGEYTAAPADGRLTKINIKAKRAAYYEDVNKELDEIDREVMRQLAIMNLKGAITSSEMEILRGVEKKIDHITSLVNEMRPPSLPDMASIPAGALALPHSYVDRPGVQEAVDDLVNPEKALVPYTVVGMGGGGKTVLASAVVRNASVRERFRAGIFWARAGRAAKNSLLPLLQGLAREMGAAPTDAPHGLGDMTEDESLELLRKASMAVGQPGDDVRAQMTKVVARCGRLPLVLAIAGSMPVVKGKGLVAGAWEELMKLFENVATKMWECGEQLNNLGLILETSFTSLSARKKVEFLKTSVLAAGAVAPIEMLLNLWETKDTEGTREEAEGLVSKSLLQDVGGGAYRVHDLVLEFVKIRVKADAEMVGKATSQQAQYLARLDVVKSFQDPERGADHQGFIVLDALWRSVEELSGDHGLEVASYDASVGELEFCEATADVAKCYFSVASLFGLQGKYEEAEPLYKRTQDIDEKVYGPDHPEVASILNNWAEVLKKQGKYTEAEPLCERATEILEKALGPDHPQVGTVLNNRATLLQAQAHPRGTTRRQGHYSSAR
eukprot:g14959.t1